MNPNVVETLPSLRRVVFARRLLYPSLASSSSSSSSSSLDAASENSAVITSSELESRYVGTLRDDVAKIFANESSVVSSDGCLRVFVESYGIASTWEVFRHVFVRIDDVELHAGMTIDSSKQLVYCTRDYYGKGRSEGYIMLCEYCADAFLATIRQQCENFFLPVTNCDTIVPVIMQTSLLWLAVLSFVVGCLLYARTQNFFTFALFVPFATLILTLAYNRFDRVDDETRRNRLISRCAHAKCST